MTTATCGAVESLALKAKVIVTLLVETVPVVLLLKTR
jgi:hypothetical protein